MPPDGDFAIQSIRILETAAHAATSQTNWATPDALAEWRSMQQTGPIEVSEKQLQAVGTRPILLSPMLEFDGQKRPIVAVRMAVSAGSLGRVYAVNQTQLGWEELTFPLKSDGQMHTYNIDMGGLRRWQGDVILVGLQPTDSPEAKITIESIEIADDIRGPTELEIDYFGKSEGVNRVGKPARVICTVHNSGGKTRQSCHGAARRSGRRRRRWLGRTDLRTRFASTCQEAWTGRFRQAAPATSR